MQIDEGNRNRRKKVNHDPAQTEEQKLNRQPNVIGNEEPVVRIGMLVPSRIEWLTLREIKSTAKTKYGLYALLTIQGRSQSCICI